jgi:hypothetical protein
MTKKILIFRILGNDLQGLHGDGQTIKNLEFTLIHEKKFADTEKIYLLNRIYNLNKKNEIIKLLIKYNYKFIDIPFSIDEFNKIKYPKNIDIKINKYFNRKEKKHKIFNYIEYLMDSENKKRRYFIKKLYDYNIYLININGARNFCLDYGKKHEYIWTFVLDSNAFFTNELFNNIIKSIKEDTEYICLPQIRLSENNVTMNNY